MIAETIYIMPPSAGGGGGARAATEVTEKFALDSSDASADKANNNNHNRGGSFFKRNFSHLSNQGPKFISLLYTHRHMYTATAAAGPAAVAGGARNPHRFKRSRNSCSAQPTDRPARIVRLRRRRRLRQHDECLREKFNDNRDARRSL